MEKKAAATMHQTAIELNFVDGQGMSIAHELRHGSYVLVGSSDACTLTIKGRGLSPIHCAIRFERGEVWLEDWQSDAGIHVDGIKIQDETIVRSDSRIQIGELELKVPLESDASASCMPVDTEARSTGEAASEPEQKIESTSRNASAAHVPFAEPSPCDSLLSATDWPDPYDGDEFLDHSADCELLHAEIEQLRYELADRDAQLTELTEGPGREFSTTSEEEVAMLSRLDELLSELDRNDERVAMLEELLRASEEANRADREERRHLHQWVEDIESRLGEREAEWRAENEALKHRVQVALSERDQLMRPMQLADSEVEAVEMDSREIAQMQVQRDQLQRRLDQAAEEKELIEQELRDRERQLAAREQASNELRREHLQLAQDRAALARQQAEFAAAQAEIQTAPRKPETEIDCRLREFRQHLREIHDEEQQSPRTLASKLGQLWNRLDRDG